MIIHPKKIKNSHHILSLNNQLLNQLAKDAENTNTNMQIFSNIAVVYWVLHFFYIVNKKLDEILGVT